MAQTQKGTTVRPMGEGVWQASKVVGVGGIQTRISVGGSSEGAARDRLGAVLDRMGPALDLRKEDS